MNSFFWGNILNIWIVFKKGRQACLIETSDYEFKEGYLALLFAFVELLGLVAVLDPLSLEEYPRYFVTFKEYEMLASSVKDDQEIGNLLGMTFTGDYSDFMNPRISGHISAVIKPSNSKCSAPRKLARFFDSLSPELKITEPLRVELFTEVSKDNLQLEININRLLQSWGLIFKKGFCSYEVMIEGGFKHDAGVNLRAKHVHEDDYFYSEFSEYVNDLYNFGGIDEQEVIFPEKPDRRTIEYVRALWLESMKAAGLIKSRPNSCIMQ